MLTGSVDSLGQENREALKMLATLTGGRAGSKAEGNAAGALLALATRDGVINNDPVSVLSVVQEL